MSLRSSGWRRISEQITRLQSGEEIAIDADKQLDTMSVIKLPLLAEAFRRIEPRKFAVTDRVTITDAARRSGAGIIRSLAAGAQLTVKGLLTLMVIVGDSTATDLVYGKVGGAEPVNQLMESWGLTSIKATGTADAWFKALSAAGSAEKFHRQGETPFGLSSPRDVGKLLEKMEKGEAVSKSASDDMLRIMRGQVYNSRIPRYVSGFRIPRTIGDFLPYIGNDAGILGSASRHVVTLFTAHHCGAGVNFEDAVGRISEVAAYYFAARQSNQ